MANNSFLRLFQHFGALLGLAWLFLFSLLFSFQLVVPVHSQITPSIRAARHLQRTFWYFTLFSGSKPLFTGGCQLAYWPWNGCFVAPGELWF